MAYKLVVAFAAALLVILMMTGAVQAQEPTPVPTITPTPNTMTGIELSNGGSVVIEWRVTVGEIAVVVAVLFLAAITVVQGFTHIPRSWFR